MRIHLNPSRRCTGTLAAWASFWIGCGAAAGETPQPIVHSKLTSFALETVADGLAVPWALAFLPDGRALLSERSAGRLSLLDPVTGRLTPLRDGPQVFVGGDGGMLDVIVHPGHAGNGWIYYSYSIATANGNTTAVSRARLDGDRLVDQMQLFQAEPAVANTNHFGSRLAVSSGYLFITLGERYEAERAQDIGDHHGSIVRLHDDGRVPADNPFSGRRDARPEIWSYGHRNPQGLALHPQTGQLWANEHGPRGGDEINLIERGANYGWPIITHGIDYSGEPVGAGLTHRQGLRQPVYYYVPSIAPSDMLFYTGEAFTAWQGSLFIGALALRHLNRVAFAADGTVAGEERLLGEQAWRVRLVEQDASGLLYVGVDEGLLLRLRPVAQPDPS